MISPPVNRNVFLNSFTHSALSAAGAALIQPFSEAAVRIAQAADHLRVVDRGIHLEPVADDAGVGQQSRAVLLAISGDLVDVETAVGAAEAIALPAGW